MYGIKRRFAEMLAPIAEVFARFWPMSKTEDRVLDELSAAYGTAPQEPGTPTTDES